MEVKRATKSAEPTVLTIPSFIPKIDKYSISRNQSVHFQVDKL